MPIYEYQCTECGHRCERISSVNDPTLPECTACNRMTMKKLISRVSFRLKGGGWYETDFKNSGKQKNSEHTNARENSAEEHSNSANGKSSNDKQSSDEPSSTSSDKDSSKKTGASDGD